MKIFWLVLILLVSCSSPNNHKESEILEKKQTKVEAKPWMESLKEKGIKKVSLCGGRNIQQTKKSLKKDFFINGKGYLFSGLVQFDEYWKILKGYNSKTAKEKMRMAFNQSNLWEISEDGKVKNLGPMTEIELSFKRTVKDCVEQGENNYGHQCNGSRRHVKGCCSEKFRGPKLHWKTSEGTHTLKYNPDPSVKLRVNGEYKNRFCHSKGHFKLI